MSNMTQIEMYVLKKLTTVGESCLCHVRNVVMSVWVLDFKLVTSADCSTCSSLMV